MISGGTAKHVFASAAILAFAATTARSEDAKPTPQTTALQTTASQQVPVTITGQKRDVSNRIDRRVYDIKNDPDAQTGLATDILAKLPSVQITPSGYVSLRGDLNVVVLIDGKYPAGGINAIQTLAAADIDRIEVMTNPPAQYAAYGSAGVINIITRKRHPFGWHGSANMRVTSTGGYNLSPTIAFTKGPWSIEGRLNLNGNPSIGKSLTTRTLPSTVRDTTRSHNSLDNRSGTLSVAYKLSDAATFTLQAQDWNFKAGFDNSGSFRSDGLNYDHAGPTLFSMSQHDIEATYEYNNEATGIHLTLDLDHARNRTIDGLLETDTYAAGAARYGADGVTRGPEDIFTADYERHFANGNQLTAGLSLDHHVSDSDRLFTSTGDIPGPVTNGYHHSFGVDQTISAAYISYQIPVGAWTILPGLRAENEERDVTAPGMQPIHISDLHWYPSLHLEHSLAGKTKLKLSYARRVQRPEFTKYDPGASYTGVTGETDGNPYLHPTDTDSLEAEIAGGHDAITWTTALFYRASSNTVADIVTARPDGFLVTRPANAGGSNSAGGEVTLRGPITLRIFTPKRWKYAINGNLSAVGLDRIGQGHRTYLSANGNTMLQYDGPTGNQFQANLTLTGRAYNVQGYTRGSYRLDLTWQHPLTKQVSFVASVTDLVNSQNSFTQVVDVPGVHQVMRYPRSSQTLRLGLSWKFGAEKK